MLIKKKNSRFWHVAYFVRNADGKRVKLSMSTGTEDIEKARQIEADTLKGHKELKENKRVENFLIKTAEVITSTTIKRSGIPLSLVWEKYSKDHTQAKRTERTQQQKYFCWQRFKDWLSENYSQVTTINDVSRDIAAAYIKHIQTKGSSTFNNNKGSLSSIWKILTIEAGLKENVWELFKGAENDSVRYRNFCLDEMKLIVTNSDDFWRVAVKLSFYTGMRFKDVVFFRKSQIDGNYLSLTPSKTKRHKKDVEPFIHSELHIVLDAWIAQGNPKEDYVFPEQVKLYDTPDFRIAFGNILKKCGIKDNDKGNVGFHSIRHTFVTMCEELGVDRKVVQSIVGHSNPLMTSHYSHDKESSKAISVLPSLLE